MRARGRSLGRKRVARLMRQVGLFAGKTARFVRTTDSNHDRPVAPNILDRNFSPSEPQATLAGDITYVWTAAGWVYLAVLLDLFSRRGGGVGGEHIDRHGAGPCRSEAGAPWDRRRPRPAPPHGSWQPICESRLPADSQGAWNNLQHVEEGPLLGQRRGV